MFSGLPPTGLWYIHSWAIEFPGLLFLVLLVTDCWYEKGRFFKALLLDTSNWSLTRLAAWKLLTITINGYAFTDPCHHHNQKTPGASFISHLLLKQELLIKIFSWKAFYVCYVKWWCWVICYNLLQQICRWMIYNLFSVHPRYYWPLFTGMEKVYFFKVLQPFYTSNRSLARLPTWILLIIKIYRYAFTDPCHYHNKTKPGASSYDVYLMKFTNHDECYNEQFPRSD